MKVPLIAATLWKKKKIRSLLVRSGTEGGERGDEYRGGLGKGRITYGRFVRVLGSCSDPTGEEVQELRIIV